MKKKQTEPTNRSARTTRLLRKRAVNLSLNAALVADARGLTDNLSELVNGLLAQFVQDHTKSVAAELESYRQAALQSKAFVEKYGSLSDEFSTL